jgi:hypothetical protein
MYYSPNVPFNYRQKEDLLKKHALFLNRLRIDKGFAAGYKKV